MICPRCNLVNSDVALRCDCGYDFPSGTVKESYARPETSSGAAGSLPPLASLTQRLAGQMVDSLMAFVVLGIGLGLASVWKRHEDAISIAAGVTFFAYLLLADGLPGGRSLGKRLVKTAVVHASARAPCTLAQSLVRNLPLSCLGAIDWLFIFGRKRQRLGDRMANTIVINLDLE